MQKGLELFWLLMGRASLAMALVLLIPSVAAGMAREAVYPYLLPAVFAGFLGAAFSAMGRQHARQLNMREGAYFMFGIWILIGFLGSLPYLLTGTAATFVEAVFESLSALTTTGVTCLPPGAGDRPLLLWHSLLAWFGGLGFVIVLVTVLPQVSGCFGITLSARQSIFFSPVWHKMNESMHQGASVYIVLTLLAWILFYAAGLNGFGAFIHALTGISSGGSSTDFSFLWHGSPALELAAAAVMLLSCLNLLLCWKAWQRRSLRMLWRDGELRTLLAFLFAAGLLVSLHLWHQDVYASFAESLRYGYFQVLSFASTSGFVSADFAVWPEFDKYLLLLLVFVGGCIGSTTGGMKVMRFLVLFRMMTAEFRRTLHPHMVISVKVDGLPVPMKIVSRILSFFFLYMLIFIAFSLVLSLSGITLMQAMSIAAGCLSSTGSTVALYQAPPFFLLPGWALAVCTVLMILGRIEIFSFFILLDLGAHLFRSHW